MKYADFTVKGDGFLYHQVRKMVAAVVSIGMGWHSVEKVRTEALEGKKSHIVHLVAPPQGLYLARVLYPDDKDY